MKALELKRHLETKHPDFFKWHERCLKKQILDACGSFQQQSPSIMEASYEIAFQIVKQKSLTRLEKNFLKPAWWRQTILFPEKPVQRKCSKYLYQIILYRGAFLKCLWMLKNRFDWNQGFPFVLLSDVSSCSQLLVFVRYIIHVTLETNYCSAVHLTPQQKVMI